MVIVGGYDTWRIPEMFVDQKIPVILNRLHSLPSRMDEDVDLSYKLPKLLDEAGILFCLENSGDMETMGTRNLPFYAGTARAYGIEEEKAIQLITLNAARILGIEERTGSIEVGKDATIIVSEGDALDMMTNHIVLAFIRGRRIDLDNLQKQLYRKYEAKYSGQVQTR
jgi:imidazolonepropionase-like amidohydrolase